MKPNAEELYKNYRDKAARYISSHISSIQDREDILQQVFLNAVEAIESFDESRASVGTWLYAITRNTVIDYYRRKSRQAEQQEFNEELFAEKTDSAVSEEMLETLASALEELPERERDIVILRFYYGFSAKETAERVGVSYSNVRFLQHIALKKLKEFFEENGIV